MEVFKCQMEGVRLGRLSELLPSRLTISAEFFLDQSCVTFAIWHFEELPRARTTQRNSLVWPKLSNGLLFFVPRGERVRFTLLKFQSTRLVLPLALLTPEETLL